MTGQVVSPVVPSSVTARMHVGPTSPPRPLPLPALPPSPGGGALVCGVSTLDCKGRLADSAVLGALGWGPGTRVDIRVRGGLVVVTADPNAVFSLTQQGHLRVPAVVRRWCGLTAGSRVLLAADTARQQLVGHPPDVVDAMVADAHAALLDGEAG